MKSPRLLLSKKKTRKKTQIPDRSDFIKERTVHSEEKKHSAFSKEKGNDPFGPSP